MSAEPLHFKTFPRSSERLSGVSETLHLITSLSLSDENESIGANDGEAEVDKDDGAFGTNVPEGRKKGEEKLAVN